MVIDTFSPLEFNMIAIAIYLEAKRFKKIELDRGCAADRLSASPQFYKKVLHAILDQRLVL